MKEVLHPLLEPFHFRSRALGLNGVCSTIPQVVFTPLQKATWLYEYMCKSVARVLGLSRPIHTQGVPQWKGEETH